MIDKKLSNRTLTECATQYGLAKFKEKQSLDKYPNAHEPIPTELKDIINELESELKSMLYVR